MKKLTQDDMKRILQGANLLGTGGGGTYQEGLEILQDIKESVNLVDLNELRSNDLICTVFGVGGKKSCDGAIASQFAYKKLCQVLGKKILAIIPVETGTVSLATAFLISSCSDIPVVNSDIVGHRSAPEIYLETITLKKYSRTPCVVADDKNNFLEIIDPLSDQELEDTLRQFAVKSGGDAYVAGYPLLKKQLEKVTPNGSISESLKIGQLLEKLNISEITLKEFIKDTGFVILGTGDITSQQNTTKDGFESGNYQIKDKETVFDLIYKNENIVLIKNDQVILTCPDSICLLNLLNYQGVNNFEENTGARVAILAKKAIPIWRTAGGKKLFSPRSMGLNYNQVLLQ